MQAEISVASVGDFAALAADWRALEQDAPDASFFQSWTWMGCLAEERYPDPILVRAERAGRLVGLALFNRSGARLCLAESGDRVRDAPFIEHNGPLLADGGGDEMAAAMFRAAWRVPGVRRLVLGGVAPAVALAAGGAEWRGQERLAPHVDLTLLRAAGTDHLATLSQNTRYQIRRAERALAARGPLRLQRAATTEEAAAWLAALIALHQASWRQRGKPGAFADPFMHRFHETLVKRAMARQEVDMLRLSAGEDTVGYLYNFRWRGRVYAYQSGFTAVLRHKHEKPGLCSHALAIARSVALGDACYDFLAGADRYKLSLCNGRQVLTWVELVRPWSLHAVLAGLVRRARGGRGGIGHAPSGTID